MTPNRSQRLPSAAASSGVATLAAPSAGPNIEKSRRSTLAVINGFIAPPLLVLVMLVANNRKVMGNRRNHWVSNALGWLAAAVMSAAAVVLALTTVRF